MRIEAQHSMHAQSAGYQILFTGVCTCLRPACALDWQVLDERGAMNSTEAPTLALHAFSALPTQLTSLPAAVTAVVCVCLTCLWLLKSSLEADDWHKLPGPPSTLSSVFTSVAGEVSGGSPSKGSPLAQVQQPVPPAPAPSAAAAARLLTNPLAAPLLSQARVHRFFQDNTRLYGAGGLWGFRLAHLRVVVLASPEAVQAVVSRGNDLPKAAILYDGIDTVGALRLCSCDLPQQLHRLAACSRCGVQQVLQ